MAPSVRQWPHSPTCTEDCPGHSTTHPVLGWLTVHEPVEVGPHHHHYLNQTDSSVTMTDTQHSHLGGALTQTQAAHRAQSAAPLPGPIGPPCTLPCQAVSS